MPKRIPTPEPGDDEPKYFTVVQPYPLNANWELPHDYITCGRWIAGCIGPAPFFAIFYKPSARGQIILEVNRDYPEPERLLGEHRWSEFLKKPNAEEAGRVSQIFYCTYSTGRQAQKDGWKRINVADSWFKNWNPVNPVIMNPYPPTVWCPLPPEDKTNKSMCRPLPVAVKAPPAPKAAPAPVVPGSATWVSQKSAPPTNTPAAMRGAWAAKQGTVAAGNNAKKPNAKNNGGGGKKAIPANSAAPWHTATAPTGSNTVPVAKNTTHNMPQNTPAFPPGLPPLSPPGLTRDASGSTSTASSSSASSEAAAYLPVTALTAGFVGISISPSMEANLYGVAVETSPDPGAYVAEWEKMPAEDVDALWPSAYKPGDGGDLYEYVVKDDGGKGGAAVENLWGDEPDDNAKVNAKPPNDVVCTVHGIICKKGICSERARLVREKERAEKLENERSGKGKGGGGWNKGGAGRGKSGNSNGGGWEKKKGNPWQPDDDSGSATGSEGRDGRRSPATPKNDGWATVRR
ncbi:hypothetical protein K438DRAFT_1859848 [Mycena galopus ATCC 62051]|nr:hypothetical protein K438DRAFT_1859848 [Mycena galopus ATCC 62051]